MMLENRSYDHLFGARELLERLAGDGLTTTMTNPDVNGNPIAPSTSRRADQLCVADPPHDWDRSHAQWNNGASDGFVHAAPDEPQHRRRSPSRCST